MDKYLEAANETAGKDWRRGIPIDPGRVVVDNPAEAFRMETN